MNVASACRAYIVYRHKLFGDAVRSVLEQQGCVLIVGMENDVTRAELSIRDLQAEVILVEEPIDHAAVWPIFKAAGASRIVTLSLEHVYATVYDAHRTEAGDPVDLIKAMQGERKREPLQSSALGPQGRTASMASHPEHDSERRTEERDLVPQVCSVSTPTADEIARTAGKGGARKRGGRIPRASDSTVARTKIKEGNDG